MGLVTCLVGGGRLTAKDPNAAGRPSGELLAVCVNAADPKGGLVEIGRMGFE